MTVKKRGRDVRPTSAESAATPSEPRIQLASDPDEHEREPMPTLPEIDPAMGALESDGYAPDTIPAPPLQDEAGDEPET